MPSSLHTLQDQPIPPHNWKPHSKQFSADFVTHPLRYPLLKGNFPKATSTVRSKRRSWLAVSGTSPFLSVQEDSRFQNCTCCLSNQTMVNLCSETDATDVERVDQLGGSVQGAGFKQLRLGNTFRKVTVCHVSMHRRFR